MKKKIAIVTNIIPSYREGFYNKLLKNEDTDITIYCQKNIPNTKLKTIHDKYSKNVIVVKFIDFFNEKMNIQFLPFFRLLKNYDTVFIDGNPRYFSHFILANLFRFLKPDKVILWSMIHSYKANSFTENIRLNWTKKFKRVFTYNDKEVEIFKEKGYTGICIGMNNGLDQEKIENVIAKWTKEQLEEWQKENSVYGKKVILSCTRLIQKNELDKFLEHFPEVLNAIPDVKWYVIGDGDQRQNLEKIVNEKGLGENVIFLGEIYEEAKLAPWFLTASVMIHPAAIGLSILHAYGYGLPIITHSDYHFHGPEFSALVEGKNSITYEKDNYLNLVEKVIFCLENEQMTEQLGLNAKKTVQEKFNVNKMVERFLMISARDI
ncbi:glycosyltransferase family 4 protein [Chryseobacterium sp. G0201]|uniref:glycosyltransferase family 4 protein n=1 Tax=Chryseobacterium sp. G0201 TaxID=2487065 RepID=UPI000F4DBB21|nr:glycosyltransferase [Chryseobacterium sp. G0201]AZA51877.1 glycosyltransferase [Chryseobacterium sp. G0201]